MGSSTAWLIVLWILALVHGGKSQKMIQCDTPTDVVFLLDASSSIEPEQWRQEKQFVGEMLDHLAVESHAINVGIIVYSTEIGQVVDLQPFKTRNQLKSLLPLLNQTRQVTPRGEQLCGGHIRPEDLQSEGLDRLSCTDTAEAISAMRDMMRDQARDHAKRIAVVITDGRSDNSNSTIVQAHYARQEGITMVALGVGNETFIHELQEVSQYDANQDKAHLYTVQDFAELGQVIHHLQELICKDVTEKPTTIPTTTTTTTTTTTRTTTTPVIPDLPAISCPRPADVVFLLDGSYSISPEDWVRGRVFVTALLKSLEIDPEAIHAGIIVYSSALGDTMPLKPFLDKQSVLGKASGLNQPPLGRTNTALGLQAMRTMLRNQGRPEMPHIGIVITDGKSNNVRATIREAQLAKEEGVVMLVIGVGQDILLMELEAMATSQATLFNVSDFSALFGIAEALKKRICIATASTTTTTTTTTTRPPPVIPSLCEECLVEGGVGYNSYPPDCSKYVECNPEGTTGSYRAVIKDCPFGLFWSSQAVACVDAAYVNCTADPCRGQPEGWGHTRLTSGCGEYWVCRGGHSIPHCCPAGHSYSSMTGCEPVATCRDHCSTEWTLAGSGACPYRPDPEDPFSFQQVMPGSGHVTKPCEPGKVYSHSQCQCVFNSPTLGCVPSLHYAFDGTFDDRSSHRHVANIHRVLLTRHNTAFFNGTSHVRVDSMPPKEFKDTFVLRLRYRVKPDRPAEVQWNDHYNWGLQEWFSSHGSQHQNLTFTGRPQLPEAGPEPGLPSGQQTSTLEKVVILHNGTVLTGSDGGAAPAGGGWPDPGSSKLSVSEVHLGPMQHIKEAAVSGGVLYVPSKNGEILVFGSKDASAGSSAQWQVVSKDGRVLKSGTGEVPASISSAFNFKLRPEPTARWFIMTADGTVLNQGEGTIPEKTRNLYKAFTSGRLMTVDQVGDRVVQWMVSRPDGSQPVRGKGSIPADLQRQLKLDRIIRMDGSASRRWAVLDGSGEVLQSGTGDIPTGVMSKYSRLGSALMLTDSDSHWQLQRTDGTTLLEGGGTLPAGVARFIRGSTVLPSLVKESSWSVMLPNGTRLSGKGPVPEHVKRLFGQSGTRSRWTRPVAGRSRTYSTVQRSRWFVTDGSGQVLESGYGEVPQKVADRHQDSVDTRVVQQHAKQGSNTTRWELRGKGGAVLARGEGQPSPHIFKVVKVRQPSILIPPTDNRGTITSGANVPRRKPSNRPSSRPAGPSTSGQSGVRSTQRWSITLPDGSVKSGQGEIPAHLRDLVARHNVKTTRRWSVTMPDGTLRSGEGDVPADIKALLAAKGSGGRRVETTRRWTVTMPDGSTRSGTGEMPADLKALMKSQGSGGRRVETTRRWTVTMPDGSTRSGTGEMPANLKALLAAQGSGGRRVETTRRWTVTMPDGSTRSGTGEIPANLKALMRSQDKQVQRQWSITLPNGTATSGSGDVPADLQALLNAQGATGGVKMERRWSVKMPDGSVRSGKGPVPADLASLLASASAKTLSRGRRATRERYQDVVGNCGSSGSPSYLLSTSQHHVQLTLATTTSRRGVTLTLPISPGMNDVQFVYDGKTLNGFSNGLQKSLPLSGMILPVQAPVTIGRCHSNIPGFRGEIDEVSLSSCIP